MNNIFLSFPGGKALSQFSKVRLFSLSLYLLQHCKEPSLMTAYSISCVTYLWHVDVIRGIMKAVTSQDNHHGYEPCRFKLWISQLSLGETLKSQIIT